MTVGELTDMAPEDRAKWIAENCEPHRGGPFCDTLDALRAEQHYPEER